MHVNADSEPITETPAESQAFDFESVFHAHYYRVMRTILRIVKDRDRAEDLAVDVFWKLWRKSPLKTSDAGGWLYRTAVRGALDALRRQARREKYEKVFTLGRANPTPEQLHSEGQQQARVRAVLASIPKRQSELLILRGEGMSYQEIAETLKINAASIGTLVNRAQQAFRKEYVRRYGKNE
jgi:RNA polymerase sigma-70 factor (ECF subfamily)